jgi:hypothetical protein
MACFEEISRHSLRGIKATKMNKSYHTMRYGRHRTGIFRVQALGVTHKMDQLESCFYNSGYETLSFPAKKKYFNWSYPRVMKGLIEIANVTIQMYTDHNWVQVPGGDTRFLRHQTLKLTLWLCSAIVCLDFLKTFMPFIAYLTSQSAVQDIQSRMATMLMNGWW